ncbi:hypothetical protein ABZP36_035813 [Zizania latifolia]
MGDLPPPPRLMTPLRRQSEPPSESDWDGSSREGSPDLTSAGRRAARSWSDDPAAQISRDWVQMAARDRDDEPPPDNARLRIRGRQARLELFRFRLENIVQGQAVSQPDASSAQNVEVSTNGHYEPSPTSEYVLERHQRAGTGVGHQQIEGAATVSESGSNTPSIAEGLYGPHSQVENWQDDLEQERRDWEQFPHAITGRTWHGNTDNGSSHEDSDVGGGQDAHIPESHNESTSTNDNLLPETQEELHGSNLLQQSREEWNEDNNPFLSTDVHEVWHSNDHLRGVNEEWHDDDESNGTTDNWHDDNSDQPTDHDSALIRRANTFVPANDDNVYSTELRELLSRRSVSNLLHSAFRENLDRLIRSYIERQGRGHLSWDLEGEGAPPAPDSPEQSQEQQRDGEEQELHDTVDRPSLVIPPPPIPPRQPIWHSELHRNNWIGQNIHRSDIEWEAINDLRADMARLQQGMSHMQRMLEACMDMQQELQRSVVNTCICVNIKGASSYVNTFYHNWEVLTSINSNI